MSATTTEPALGAGPEATTRARAKRFGFFAGVVVIGAVALALLGAANRTQDAGLDPQNAGPTGTMALVEVLRAQGVQVDIARSAGDLEDQLSPGATLVIGNTEYLGQRAGERARSAAEQNDARTVIVMPSQGLLDAWELPVIAYPGAPDEPVTASCTDPAVKDGDRIVADGRVALREGATPGGAVLCFPVKDETGEAVGGSGMVRLPATGERPEVVVTAFPEAFTNRYITDHAHAGVVLRVLGQDQRLVWYHPGIDDLLDGDEALEEQDPWPAWQWPAIALLGVAFVVFSLWSGRRLGRLVPEPLPVVVRAVESTEARAQLYHRSKDRARAAAILRHGTVGRLRRRLGLGPGGPDPALIDLTARATRTPAPEVAAILTGPAPVDDTELMRLAQQLHDLEEKVTHE